MGARARNRRGRLVDRPGSPVNSEVDRSDARSDVRRANRRGDGGAVPARGSLRPGEADRAHRRRRVPRRRRGRRGRSLTELRGPRDPRGSESHANGAVRRGHRQPGGLVPAVDDVQVREDLVEVPGPAVRADARVQRVAPGVRELFFFSSRRRHTRFDCDWSSDVCSSDLALYGHYFGGTFGPDDFFFNNGFNFVLLSIAMLVVGGMTSVTGAVTGCYFVTIVYEIGRASGRERG